MIVKIVKIVLVLTLVFFLNNTISVYSSPPELVLFPDEYTELDDEENTQSALKSKYINPILEKAVMDYQTALEYITVGDTAKAAYRFEVAISRLNPLASYPNIEDNTEYIELFQTIIDDYKLFIQSTDFIDEDTPFHIVQELYIEDEDSLEYDVSGYDEFEPEFIAFEPGYIPPPENMLVELTDNKYVEKNIDFYTKTRTGKIRLQRTLERSSKWFPMFKKHAKEVGVPEELIYISIIESALNPNAVSKAKAVGMWQFMRSTGAMYGLNNPPSMFMDERRDPEKATKAAMEHLLDLYLVFGDWHLAFAAYNCGQGCVSRAIRKAISRDGIKKEDADFWKIRKYLYRETRYYVPHYIAVAKLFSDPEKYGIELDSLNFQDEYRYDVVHLDTAISLFGLAKCAEITEDELRSLNPELIKASTPLKGYNLKIPSGSKGLFELKFSQLPDLDKQPFFSYAIKKRETVSNLSKKFGVAKSELVFLNKLSSSKARLKKGDTLLIPVDPRKWKVAEELPDDYRMPPELDDHKAYVTHTVHEGETLLSIAKNYNVNPAVLQELNDFNPEEHTVKEGEIIIIAQRDLTPSEIKVKMEKKAKARKNKAIIKHKVKTGESLHGIANKYYTTIDEIKNLNNIIDYNLYTGQILKIASTEKYKEIKAEEKRRNAPRRNRHGDIIHKVRRGQTLSGIADKYNTTAQKIRDRNPNDVNGDNIKAGSTLQITGKVRFTKKAKSNAPAQKTPADGYYIVKSGESFSTIAQKFGKTADQLMALNPGVKPEYIQIGQKIKVK